MTTFAQQLNSYRSEYLSWDGFTWTMCGGYRKVEWSGPNSPDPKHPVHNAFNKLKERHTNELLKFSWSPYGVKTTDAAKMFSSVANTIVFDDSWDQSSLPSLVDMWKKVSEELYGHQLNAAVAFAEGNQTLELLTSTATRVRRSWLALKRGDVRRCFRELGYRNVTKRTMRRRRDGTTVQLQKIKPGFNPASVWLEHRYGWMPLYSDVYESMRFIYALTNKPLTKRFKVNVQKKGPYATRPGAPLYALKNYRKTRTTRYIELYEDYTPSLWGSLGFDNPELVLWEKVPFSFVFDWFLPVGNYLEARGIQRRLNGLAYNVHHSESHFLGATGNQALQAALGTDKFIVNPEQAVYERYQMRYSRGTKWDIRSAGGVKLPTLMDLWKFPTSWQKAVTSVALITTLNEGRQARNFIR